jgi:hypothetical protein
MQTLETNVPGLPGFSRRTWVTRVGGGVSDTLDYRVITVRVAPPGYSLANGATNGTMLQSGGSTDGGTGRNIGETVGQVVHKTTIVGAF